MVSDARAGSLLRDYRFWLLLLLATLLRCWDPAHRSLSGDESYSLMLSQQPVGDIPYWTGLDVHPPLYYLLLHLWLTVFGDSVMAARLLSAVPGVITVFVQAWLMSLLAGRRAALLAALLLAIAPFLVRYSQEVRMYSWLALWAWAATLVLVLWLRKPARWPLLGLYTVLMTAGFYTHYFAGLTLLTHWVYLAWLRVRRGQPQVGAPAWWAATGLIAVLFVPWLPNVLEQLLHTDANLGWIPAVTPASLPTLLWTFAVLGPARTLPMALWVMWPAVLVVVGLVLIVTERCDREPAALLFAALVVPLMAVLAVAWHLSLFYPRYLIYCAGAAPMLIALALDRLWSRRKWLVAVGLAVSAWMAVVGLQKIVSAQDQVEPWSGPDDRIPVLVDVLNAHARTGDWVLTGSPVLYMRLFFYMPSGPPLRWMAGSDALGAENSPSLFFHDRFATTLTTFADVPDAVCRFWWVNYLPPPELPAPVHEGWRLAEGLRSRSLGAWLYVRETPCAQ